MKDPAFLFYPNDYVGGTMGMTFEEKGAYVELLMAQFNRGHMTKDMIGQVLGHKFGQIWEVVQHKFIQDSEGRYYNVRLEEEQKKRKAFVDSRKNNIKGINKYTKNKETKQSHMDGHMASHMEDENKYINYNSINSNIQYVESIYRRLILGEKIKMSYEKFTSLITEFITTQELQEKKYFDEKDYKNHFFNWMKIKIKDAKNHDKLRQLA
jgi:uncharacterized protein YdaU (DUF1376 family)